ncbi:ABC transporter permease [Williamsia phyllosphaerae]|uniref:Osmoprotectant (Glycine betaine/ carnitine/choline/l-proline) ABC transporter ProW n=1 Tax=Williamsia phyllosphaerae TaxID=885042 RepID=A0ABQ1UHU8_9NOCA|nr:ABC transporter permease [Williamsia phyllosphaerae]GGF19229.1 putative osmoprotectant (glycine betaine/ carnitine/choline/l-proline) ABC transporter ProW [Williamsia phyllosphaerae]
MTYLFTHFDKVWSLLLEHLKLSLIPIVVALVIAIPLGLAVHRSSVARRIAVIVGSVVFTVPSIALFIVLPSLINTRILSDVNVIVALALYATALLVRSIPEALDAVPVASLDAAEAVGYKPWERVVKVQLPLAIPVLIASIRVVSVTNISMVSVGSVIGFGGLGKLFTEGYSRNYTGEIIAGIIATVVLALVIDVILVALGRVLTPWTRASRPTRRLRRRAVPATTPQTTGMAAEGATA